MNKESSLTMKRIGVEVRERFSVQVRLSESDLEEAIMAPQDVLKRLLERAGHPVNHIEIGGWDPRGDEICDYMHVVYPEEERSMWIIVNCEPL